MADIVTKHAVLRYCERVLGVRGIDVSEPSRSYAILHKAGIDVRAVAGRLAEIAAEASLVGASRVKRGGFAYVLEDGFLVIVLRAEQRPAAPRRKISRTSWHKGRRVRIDTIERVRL